MFIDSLGRKIDYLRISVTDRCNLRCIYCMPLQGIETVTHEELLTFEEILRLVKIFVDIGIKKIRLTGGEPLVRKGIINLIESLINIKGIEEVSLTTNGLLLSSYAEQLKKAGIKRINVSLDTLRKEKFEKITRSNTFHQVFMGIEKAKKLGFEPLKLNTVVMKGINDDEIIDFVEFSLSKGLILRFIEFMDVSPLWKEANFMPIEEIKKICERKFKLEKTERILGAGPAQYYKIKNDGLIGFIKTEENNCRECSRLRLTSKGELKICLYELRGLFLKGLLRGGVCNEEIRDIIKARLEIKETIDYRQWKSYKASDKAYMYTLGG